MPACLAYWVLDPTPFLDIDWRIKGWKIKLPLETTLVHITRPFTSPILFAFLVVAYIIAFAFFTRAQAFLTPEDSWIGCTSTFWLANDGCGLDGQSCAPFSNQTYEFRCPAQCDGVILQNPRTVGDEQVVFEPLIVGGGDNNKTYRGDSFICAAAQHAYVARPTASCDIS